MGMEWIFENIQIIVGVMFGIMAIIAIAGYFISR